VVRFLTSNLAVVDGILGAPSLVLDVLLTIMSDDCVGPPHAVKKITSKKGKEEMGGFKYIIVLNYIFLQF